MKKLNQNTLFIALAILTVTAFFAGCKKNSSTDNSSNQVSQMELKLGQDYTIANQYNMELANRLELPGITLMDSICRGYDSLFHMHDTLFTINFREYCTDMMEEHGMGTNGMMHGGMMGNNQGGMMCNMDSLIMSMNGMMHMTTYKMDSLMNLHMENCPSMGTMSSVMQDTFRNMQTLRKSHMVLHHKG